MLCAIKRGRRQSSGQIGQEQDPSFAAWTSGEIESRSGQA